MSACRQVELINILNHSGARMLLFENDFAPLVEMLQAGVPGDRALRYAGRENPGCGSYLRGTLGQRPSRAADIFSYDEAAVAELFYTSGSTGTPKGVMLGHRTLYLHALAVASLFEDVDNMVDLHTIPLFHANGWGRPQASTLLGIKQIMVRRFEPGDRVPADPENIAPPI